MLALIVEASPMQPTTAMVMAITSRIKMMGPV
jgi:hypothetical protein